MGHDGRVLHLRMRVPSDLSDEVVGLLDEDPTVVNVAVLPHAYRKPDGCMVMADVARESAQTLLSQLHKLGVARSGAIAIDDDETVLSDAATQAERAAPGRPEDGVVWDILEDNARADSEMSLAFVVFLTLATLIASVGRLQDQPILIVGAMVVGPEFAPVAAICLALARPRLSILPKACSTLFGGYVIATVIASIIWTVVYRAGGFAAGQLAHRPLTDFIVQPNIWSLVIALIAGAAGTLSLTTDKSSTLVGVFISVTTIPAVGTLALAAATLDGGNAVASLIQLSVNIAGMIVAGTATLFGERFLWRRVGTVRPRARRRPHLL